MAGRSTFQIVFEAVTGPMDKGLKKTGAEADQLTRKLAKTEHQTLEVREATVKVEQAQVRAARAAKRYGQDSLEAQAAQVKLERAQRAGIDTTKRSTHAFSATASAVKAASVAFAGFAVADFLKDSAEAARDSEVSQAKLQTQLKASGISYRAHAKDIDKVIQKTSQLAGLDDEDLQDAFTGIVRATGKVSEAMKLTGVAADLARAKHIDVAKAGEIVGKVSNGNVGALKRYGIAFAPVTSAVERLKETVKKYTPAQLEAAKAQDKQATATSALALLQQRFAGQAEAYGKTSAGAQERLGVAMENLKENVGKSLAPALATAANGLASFVSGMQDGSGAGGKFVAKVKEIAGAISSTFSAIRSTVTNFVKRNRADIDNVISAFRSLGNAVKSVIQNVVLPVVRSMLPGIKQYLGGVVTFIRGIVKIVSGILSGDWSKAWDGAKDVVKGAIRSILGVIRAAGGGVYTAMQKLGGAALHGLGSLLTAFYNFGKRIVQRLVDGVKSLPGKVSGAVTGLFKGATAKIPFIGDGLGRKAGKASGGLMGANSALAPFASLGSRYGLSVSSGKRASGGLTSSGGVSYHGSGEAIDLANGRGPDAAKLSAFNALKFRFGPQLAELIYTPGGLGIKNGQPYQYTGSVAADHNDHVHVAFDLGRRGAGIGDGIGAFMGDGTGKYDAGGLKTLWGQAGGSSSAASTAAAVALAESGGNPGASNRNTDGSIDRGLWQINSVHGALSTFSPTANARAAVQISNRGANWRPWVTYNTGAYRRFLSAASSARTSSAAAAKKTVGKLSVTAGGGTFIPSIHTGANVKPATISAGAQAATDSALAQAQRTAESQAEIQANAENQSSILQSAAGTAPLALQAAQSLASLTATTGDDLDVAKQIAAYFTEQLAQAQAAGDLERTKSAADALKSAQDAIASLDDSIKQANDLAASEAAQRQQLIDLTAEQVAGQKRLEAIATSQPQQLIAGLISAINGGIGGKVGLGFQTPSFAGGRVRY